MDNHISNTGLGALIAPVKSNGNAMHGAVVTGEPSENTGFSDLLAEQGMPAGLIDKFKGLLSEAQQKQLDSIFSDGKQLPQVADVAAEVTSILEQAGLTLDGLEQLKAVLPEELMEQLKVLLSDNRPLMVWRPAAGETDRSTDQELLDGEELPPTAIDGASTEAALAASQLLAPQLADTKNERTAAQQRSEPMAGRGESTLALNAAGQLPPRETPLSALNLVTSNGQQQGDEKLPPELLRQLAGRGEVKSGSAAVTPEGQQAAVEDESLAPLLRGKAFSAGEDELPANSLGRERLDMPATAAVPRVTPTILEGILPQVQGAMQGVTANQPSSNLQPLQRTEVPVPINIPPESKGWDNAVSDRIMWMVGNKSQSATIRITPPQLGPIEVHVVVQKDQASVNFTAHNGVVREALEAAIPRLREMFNENNLQLVNVDVGQKDAGEQRSLQNSANDADGNSSLAGGPEGGEQLAGGASDEEMMVAVQQLNSAGGIDYFA